MFPVSHCSFVSFRVKNGPSFEQSTQGSIWIPFPGSTPPSSNPAPSQDSNLGLWQQCPAQLCRSLLSLLISQGGSKYRQWPCPCHSTMTLGHTARAVFQRRWWRCAVLPDTSPPIRCRHHSWEAQLIHAAAEIPPAEQNPTAAREGEQFPGDLPSWRGATGTSTAQGCGAILPLVRLHLEHGNSALLSLR